MPFQLSANCWSLLRRRMRLRPIRFGVWRGGRWNKYEVRSLRCRRNIPHFACPSRSARQVAIRYFERVQQCVCIRIADGEAETWVSPLAINPFCFFTLHAMCNIRINTNVRVGKSCPARHCKDFQAPTNDKITPHRVVIPMLPIVVVVILRHSAID